MRSSSTSAIYFSIVDKRLTTDLRDTVLESTENSRQATKDFLKSGGILYLVAAIVKEEGKTVAASVPALLSVEAAHGRAAAISGHHWPLAVAAEMEFRK